MSSWTFETFENNNNYAEYRWNKGGTYQVIVGLKNQDMVQVLHQRTFVTKESAKKYFEKIKKVYWQQYNNVI